MKRNATIPLRLKVPYTIFVCVLVPAYWHEYGPANFLWGSNIALLVICVALWTENHLLPSMAALGVLLPELGWIIDFAVRLLLGQEALPFDGTRYMFDPGIPLWIRGLSLYHIALPIVLVWLLYGFGYQPRALIWQTLLALLVLPLTYAVSDPAASINWVYGFGSSPQTMMPGPVFVLLLMVLFPVTVYLPTHLLLSRFFPEPHRTRITLR
jgi:hypothetical protein